MQQNTHLNTIQIYTNVPAFAHSLSNHLVYSLKYMTRCDPAIFLFLLQHTMQIILSYTEPLVGCHTPHIFLSYPRRYLRGGWTSWWLIDRERERAPSPLSFIDNHQTFFLSYNIETNLGRMLHCRMYNGVFCFLA